MDFPEVAHTIPVLSLDKAYSSEAVLQWMQRTETKGGSTLAFVVEEKIDGVSIVLYYEDGLLVRAVTRGNGFIGNDVTGNIKTIGAVPLRLKQPLSLAVRGEVYLPKSEFALLNAEMEIPYANPRNLAAGTVRRIKSSEAARVPLQVFVYEAFWDADELQCASHVEILALLQGLGFRVNPSVGVFAATQEKAQEAVAGFGLTGVFTGEFSEVHSYIERLASQREALDHEIDGLVVKVDNLSLREQSATRTSSPMGARL